jgi:hypothetical protein
MEVLYHKYKEHHWILQMRKVWYKLGERVEVQSAWELSLVILLVQGTKPSMYSTTKLHSQDPPSSYSYLLFAKSYLKIWIIFSYYKILLEFYKMFKNKEILKKKIQVTYYFFYHYQQFEYISFPFK